MLKSTNHDSMSGEHVGTTSGLIVTSGRLDIWPWETLENHDLERCENSQGGRRKT